MSVSSRQLFVAVCAVAIVLLVPLALWPTFLTSSDFTPNVRKEVLDQLTGSLKLGPRDRLEWAPAVGVTSYRLGSVFLPDENLIRFSENCDEVQSVNTQGQRSLSKVRSFNLSPRAQFPPLLESVASDDTVSAELRAASRIRYSLQTTGTELISSKQTLLRNLVDDADCLADIASRRVHVLAARILGRETYEIEQSLYSEVTAKLGGLFSAGGDSEQASAGRIKDEDPRVVLWAFTEMELTDTRVPTDAPHDFRLMAAKDLAATETSYWQVAEENTQFRRPDASFFEKFHSSAADDVAGGR